MSRSSSPASVDSRPDTDFVSNFVHGTECPCDLEHLRATQLRIFRHKLWDTSIMAWATHNFISCGFAKNATSAIPRRLNFRRPEDQEGKKARLDVNIHPDDVTYEYLQIRGAPADYGLLLFNCKAWATLFCKNIAKRTRILAENGQKRSDRRGTD
ncbi:hypothetical protein niasHS_013200 [Heterodera schachtii]|uniref:Uncharacterized protein n=1 Tax=Heterodera schachtii TaxID=97005 RepID=A0ABD2ID56_HETSC